MDAASPTAERLCYELRFGSLFDPGRAYSFPCDASGRVDLDALSEAGRRNYRLACAAVGRDVGLPELKLTPASRTR
jgi:hypothetical protein